MGLFTNALTDAPGPDLIFRRNSNNANLARFDAWLMHYYGTYRDDEGVEHTRTRQQAWQAWNDAFLRSTWSSVKRWEQDNAAQQAVEDVPPPEVEAWTDGKQYYVGDLAQEAGADYGALDDHIAAADTKPGVGANWETMWKRVTEEEPEPEGQVRSRRL